MAGFDFKPFHVPELGFERIFAFLILSLLNDCNSVEQSNSVTTSPSNVFTPFGGGPRLCPGYELARVALSVFLHRLVTGFRYTFTDKKIAHFFHFKMLNTDLILFSFGQLGSCRARQASFLSNYKNAETVPDHREAP